MEISNNYILVVKYEEPVAEGFKAVEVQDSFVYKGVVDMVPLHAPVYIGDNKINVGDVAIFQKYSPDTIEIEFDGVKKKFVKVSDLLAIIRKK